MSRPQSTAQLDHVPTPEIVLQRLRGLLNIPNGCFALDPCCGTGDALSLLAPTARRYGVELDMGRAKLAAERFADVLPCAIQDSRISNASFGLILLNPPYNASTEGRLETVFLTRATRYLIPGGILLLMVKEDMIPSLAEELRNRYDIIGHWRFPAGWFDGPHLAFRQTVLVARLRDEPTHREPWDFNRMLRLGSLDDLPDIFDDRVQVPTGRRPAAFISAAFSPDELERLLQESPVPRRMIVPAAGGTKRPLLPLKQGHVALALASGLVNGIYGAGPTRHVAKGLIIRHVSVTKEADTTTEGNVAMVEKRVDSFSIVVRTLTTDGEIHEMHATPPKPEAEEEAA